jgi:hypothetical protein
MLSLTELLVLLLQITTHKNTLYCISDTPHLTCFRWLNCYCYRSLLTKRRCTASRTLTNWHAFVDWTVIVTDLCSQKDTVLHLGHSPFDMLSLTELLLCQISTHKKTLYCISDTHHLTCFRWLNCYCYRSLLTKRRCTASRTLTIWHSFVDWTVSVIVTDHYSQKDAVLHLGHSPFDMLSLTELLLLQIATHKKTLYCISDTHQRTVKYFMCLAANIPTVSHQWIRDSCMQVMHFIVRLYSCDV